MCQGWTRELAARSPGDLAKPNPEASPVVVMDQDDPPSAPSNGGGEGEKAAAPLLVLSPLILSPLIHLWKMETRAKATRQTRDDLENL